MPHATCGGAGPVPPARERTGPVIAVLARRAAALDELSRRFARNVAILVSSGAATSVLGLATLSLTAHALGPAALGTLALIEAYGRTVDRLVRLEPWHAVIRFGAARLEASDRDGLARLIRGTTLFDGFGALLATTVALALLAPLAELIGLDEDGRRLAALFAMSLVVSVSATPIGVLRLFDRFGLLAWWGVAVAVMRFLATLAAWSAGMGLGAFVAILIGMQLASHLGPFVLSWRELRRQGLGDAWRVPLAGLLREEPELPRFVLNSNLNVILRSLTQRLDVLIVGAWLGQAAAGLYHLARRSAMVAMALGRPIQQAVYPEIARLWARGDRERFIRLLLRTNVAIGALGFGGVLVAWAYIDRLIVIAFGADFLGAAPVLVAQGFAMTLFLAGVTLNPALLSMGRDRALVGVSAAASATFFLALVPLMGVFGATGAAGAHILYNAVWLGSAILLVMRGAKRPRGPAPAPAGAGGAG